MYVSNPEAQKRLINNLFALASFESTAANNISVLEALEMIIVAFSHKFPEYLSPKWGDREYGSYTANPLLLHRAEALIKEQRLELDGSDALAFESVYRDNSNPQARFIESLLGFRESHTSFAVDDDSSEIVREIELVVRTFTQEFSDYLKPKARSDAWLIRMVEEILENQHAA